MSGIYRVLSPQQLLITHVMGPGAKQAKVSGFALVNGEAIPIQEPHAPLSDSEVPCLRMADGKRVFVDEKGGAHAEVSCEIEMYVRYPESEQEAYALARAEMPRYTPIFAEKIKDGVYRVILAMRSESDAPAPW